LKWLIAIGAWLLVGVIVVVAESIAPTRWWHFIFVVVVLGPLLLFGEGIAQGLLGIVCYGVGRVVLPIASLGQARAERGGDVLSFPWYGVGRDSDKHLVVSADGTALFGVFALGAGGTGIFLAYRWLVENGV